MLATGVAPFDRLTALDAVFLGIESERNPMHVGLTAVFEAGPLRTPSGELDGEAIRRQIRAVLASFPKFRRRLHRIPLFLRPVLVDDPAFDLDHHLRFLSLVRGDETELREVVSRIYSERIDRRRPLWELWVIDGLSGDRFAIVTKAHHCLIDGVSGIAVLTAMLRPTPDRTIDEAVPFGASPPPTARDLLRAELRRIMRPPDTTLAGVRDAARTLAVGLSHAARSVFPRASDTSLRPSPPLARRSIAWLELPLADVKAVTKASAAKVNDVVLATVSGALSRLVARQGERRPDRVFRALVPVNVRAPADVSIGNEVSILLVSLPTGDGAPLETLRLVTERMRVEKASQEVEAVAAAEHLADAWSFGLATASVRLATLLRPYNLIITNVRGPELPLYLLGARLVGVFPLVPLYGTDTLGVALVSYDDKLCWGLSGDVAGEADLTRLAMDLRTAFDALRESVSGTS